MHNMSPFLQELFKWGTHIYEDEQEEEKDKKEKEEEDDEDDEEKIQKRLYNVSHESFPKNFEATGRHSIYHFVCWSVKKWNKLGLSWAKLS